MICLGSLSFCFFCLGGSSFRKVWEPLTYSHLITILYLAIACIKNIIRIVIKSIANCCTVVYCLVLVSFCHCDKNKSLDLVINTVQQRMPVLIVKGHTYMSTCLSDEKRLQWRTFLTLIRSNTWSRVTIGGRLVYTIHRLCPTCFYNITNS